MQQRLEVVNRLENAGLNSDGVVERTVTYVARSVNGNGIDLNLQIIVRNVDGKQHLQNELMQTILDSNGTNLGIGSIIQIELKHRYQNNSH